MTAKEWLRRAYNIDKQIKSKLELIEMWRELSQRLVANYSGSSKAVSGDCRAEKYGILIADAEAEVKEETEELINVKREIGRTLRQIGVSEYRLLLEQRYMLCKPWGLIAGFLDFQEEHVRGYMHGKAVKEVQKLIQLDTH